MCFESRTDDLPALNIRERTVLAEELEFAVGRQRLPGYAFLMMRGFLGGIELEVGAEISARVDEFVQISPRPKTKDLSFTALQSVRGTIHIIFGSITKTRMILEQKQEIRPCETKKHATGK